MVTVHPRLLRHLGSTGPRAVVGGSLGGMQALEWLPRHPGDAFLLRVPGYLRAVADSLGVQESPRLVPQP